MWYAFCSGHTLSFILSSCPCICKLLNIPLSFLLLRGHLAIREKFWAEGKSCWKFCDLTMSIAIGRHDIISGNYSDFVCESVCIHRWMLESRAVVVIVMDGINVLCMCESGMVHKIYCTHIIYVLFFRLFFFKSRHFFVQVLESNSWSFCADCLLHLLSNWPRGINTIWTR